MTHSRAWIIGLLGAIAVTASAAAQQLPGPVPAPAPGADAQSAFQQRLGQFVKRQLGLTDDQYQRVVAVNQKYAQQRFLLVQQEREIRITIRDEVLRGDSADQQRVARLLDDMMKVQTQRLQILQSEQKDLSAILTPVQRAKYLGIQEQVRKRLEAMRQGNGSGGAQNFRRRFQPQPPAPPPQQ